MNFFHNLPLALTPLSPIHIGSGTDIEPTNYVIEDTTLFGFDPARATLPPALAKRLTQLGDNADLLGIQRFFLDNAEHFIPHADALIPVAQGLADDYRKRVGQVANQESNGNQVFNQLFIERAVAVLGKPYIPGTALKGVLRTAWLDALNDGNAVPQNEQRNASGLEKRIFGGDFASSPLRQLKPSDLMPVSNIARQILYAVNLKKDRILDSNGLEREPRGVTTRKECILPGQYRAFRGSLTLHPLGGRYQNAVTPEARFALHEISVLVRDVNTYHVPRLVNELKVLNDRGLLSSHWYKNLNQLLNQLFQNKALEGRVMVVRLGRYGGAESKTLSGEDVAKIKIMAGRRPDGKPDSYFSSHTKTVWVAAETTAARSGLMPFGWALVEIGYENDVPALQTWCQQQSQHHPDTQAARSRCALLQQKVQEQRAAAEKAQAARDREQAQEQARLDRLTTLTPALREVEAFVQACQDRQAHLRGSKDKPNTHFHTLANQLAKKALESSDWTQEEKTAAADAIEAWLPLIVALDAKDMRKKMKLASLRGAV